MSLLGWLLHIVGEYGLSYSEGCVLFALLWFLGIWAVGIALLVWFFALDGQWPEI